MNDGSTKSLICARLQIIINVSSPLNTRDFMQFIKDQPLVPRLLGNLIKKCFQRTKQSFLMSQSEEKRRQKEIEKQKQIITNDAIITQQNMMVESDADMNVTNVNSTQKQM